MPSLLKNLTLYREQGNQGPDAGYDSDMSLEAYDLSEGPNTEGGFSNMFPFGRPAMPLSLTQRWPCWMSR